MVSPREPGTKALAWKLLRLRGGGRQGATRGLPATASSGRSVTTCRYDQPDHLHRDKPVVSAPNVHRYPSQPPTQPSTPSEELGGIFSKSTDNDSLGTSHPAQGTRAAAVLFPPARCACLNYQGPPEPRRRLVVALEDGSGVHRCARKEVCESRHRRRRGKEAHCPGAEGRIGSVLRLRDRIHQPDRHLQLGRRLQGPRVLVGMATGRQSYIPTIGSRYAGSVTRAKSCHMQQGYERRAIFTPEKGRER